MLEGNFQSELKNGITKYMRHLNVECSFQTKLFIHKVARTHTHTHTTCAFAHVSSFFETSTPSRRIRHLKSCKARQAETIEQTDVSQESLDEIGITIAYHHKIVSRIVMLHF